MARDRAILDPHPEDKSVLDEILKELRVIRAAIEHPKATAVKEQRETITT